MTYQISDWKPRPKQEMLGGFNRGIVKDRLLELEDHVERLTRMVEQMEHELSELQKPKPAGRSRKEAD